jgi:uncharacterized protein YbaA (DUF1428 family)
VAARRNHERRSTTVQVLEIHAPLRIAHRESLVDEGAFPVEYDRLINEDRPMPRYVDGFVIPLKKDRVEDYRKLSEQAAEVWKDHGALDYWECVGDDLQHGETVKSFLELAGAAEDETVIFAWAMFESREHRDACNATIMADPRLEGMYEPDKLPFDSKRMAFGGFRELVHR